MNTFEFYTLTVRWGVLHAHVRYGTLHLFVRGNVFLIFSLNGCMYGVEIWSRILPQEAQ